MPLPAAAQADPFKNTAELHLMGASMSGTVGQGQLQADIDVPAFSIFENLKFAALLDHAWASGTDGWTRTTRAGREPTPSSGTSSPRGR